MKLNEKIVKKIWKESISTLIIIGAIFIINSSIQPTPKIHSNKPETAVLNAEDLPSRLGNNVEIAIEEKSIDELVRDVETGKAGNGEDRVKYLGDKYSEVQKIINEKYKNKVATSKEVIQQRATSGNKAELQNYAYELVIAMGWSESDFLNLINLWDRESGWNPNAHNKSSGAHGIPQSLPASKMATYGEDYLTNGETQIRWGLNYILNRYGTPTKAWKHFQDKNWY